LQVLRELAELIIRHQSVFLIYLQIAAQPEVPGKLWGDQGLVEWRGPQGNRLEDRGIDYGITFTGKPAEVKSERGTLGYNRPSEIKVQSTLLIRRASRREG